MWFGLAHSMREKKRRGARRSGRSESISSWATPQFDSGWILRPNCLPLYDEFQEVLPAISTPARGWPSKTATRFIYDCHLASGEACIAFMAHVRQPRSFAID